MKNKRKCFLLLPIFLFLWGGCAQIDAYSGFFQQRLGTVEKQPKLEVQQLTIEGLDAIAEKTIVISEETELCFESPNHSTYAYDLLTEAEKIWYNDINKVLSVRSEEAVTLSAIGLDAGLDETDVDRIYQCVLIDHPEYFYVEGYEYTRFSSLGKTVGIEISGTYDIEHSECLHRKEQIDEVVEQILQNAPMQASDYEKIKYVYETIIYSTEYCMDAPDNQNIYSVFVGRNSVCQGYAKSVQYLLNCMEVDCTLVFGQVNDGEGHSWNLVKADNEYYYLDATWGDASYLTKEQAYLQQELPDINYDYLCITTEQLIKTHNIEHELDLPVCSAMKDNYYVREGCYFTDYDETQLQREFEEAMDANGSHVTIKCDSPQIYGVMYEELIVNQRVFDFLGDSHETIAYIENEPQLSLTFWMTK